MLDRWSLDKHVENKLESPFRTNGRANTMTRGLANRKYQIVGQAGGLTMTRVVMEIVMFSCIFAFVTGVVFAAANLLI